MKALTCSALFLAFATAAAAQTPTASTGTAATAQPMASIPSNSMTVTEWYKQNVYDPQDNKIGEIMDVLMDHDGKATALIIGVGGFLGAGEKDVAVPFHAVELKTKNNKPYLVMSATKDQLKAAKGFKYDRNAMTWMPDSNTR
jgi:sporulation protein YlmC with PRC-barrel domain